MILGIRPEDLEDAELEPDRGQTLDGDVELTEALGSEIMAHFSIDAPPAITDEVRELQEDAGTTEGLGTPEQEQGGRTIMVGRFGARSKATQGRAGQGRRRHARTALLRPGDGSRHLRRNRKRGSTRMTKRRFILLALLIGVLAFLAAGCGGDDNEASGAGARPGERPATSPATSASWRSGPAPRAEAFQAVLDGFTAENPDVKVAYKSASGAGDRALDRGRGRQPARHRRPAAAGLHDRLRAARRAEADRLRGGRDQGGFLAVVARPRHGRRQALRPLLQGRQQVDHLVQRARRSTDAGVEPAANWDDFLNERRHDCGVRRPALLDRRRRRLDAHRPVREHLPPHRRARRSTTS